MSAASPKTQEPSMEEILASIRRIIADDQQAKPAPVEARAPPPPPAPEPPPPLPELDDDDDVLDLAEIAPAPSLDVEVPELDFDSIELEPEPEPGPPPPPVAVAAPLPEPEPEPVFDDKPLLSQTTNASVNHAFGALAHTVLTHNARTLDDIVREMLRPMLKAWLDDNLPTMVERLVRAEIERVARGR